MRVEQKVWGRAFHVAETGVPFNASLLELLAGGYSSRHLHELRYNAFHVYSGLVDVVEYVLLPQPAPLLKEVRRRALGPGESCTVAPGVVHRFEARAPGLMLETYWADPGARCAFEDIRRLDQGGRWPERQCGHPECVGLHVEASAVAMDGRLLCARHAQGVTKLAETAPAARIIPHEEWVEAPDIFGSHDVDPAA